MGDQFKILGILFDCKLVMRDAVEAVVAEASWKLRTLLRTKRFYTTRDLTTLYKAQLLPYIEYRTPAAYHASDSVLADLDKLQTKFLREAGLSELDSLMIFRLAPLLARRDMAMLGLIHRTALGKGPAHFSVCAHETQAAEASVPTHQPQDRHTDRHFGQVCIGIGRHIQLAARLHCGGNYSF